MPARTHHTPVESLLARLTVCLLLIVTSGFAGAQEGGNQERVVERLLALAAENPALAIKRVDHPASQSILVRGTLEVPENRATSEGRRIQLAFLVLPARSAEPAPHPVFILHGGPGAPATVLAKHQLRGWLRERHDVVLIDQRGTGNSNPLTVPLAGSDDDLQGYFTPYFDAERFRAALPALEAQADLRQYTTPNSVDDFDDVRAALGYQAVHLRGGSYGTRSAFAYMRRHPERVRTATLQGIAPVSYRNPLPHARGAQEALDRIFKEIQRDQEYRKAFPDIEAKFEEILERLDKEPAKVSITHPVTGEPSEILLNRNAFAEAVRLQLYSLAGNRRLPSLLLKAHSGDYSAFAEAALAKSRGVRGLLSWGLLMCITGSEDLWRIDPAEIQAACAGAFLGETRVRNQLAIHAFWPSGRVPKTYGDPVVVDTPVLLLSGSHDPTTTPEWGEEAARHLPNALHVIVPGGHGVAGPEVAALEKAFLESATIKGLDLSAIRKLKLPPLVLPD